jgi:AbrB family looped-hinge helix DNA binding protein
MFNYGGYMTTVMKISPQGQIRIPRKFMTELGLDAGDYIEALLEGDHIALKPRKLIDPSQGWYWTKEWQEAEKEVDGEVERGEVSRTFQTAEEGVEWLKK